MPLNTCFDKTAYSIWFAISLKMTNRLPHFVTGCKFFQQRVIQDRTLTAYPACGTEMGITDHYENVEPTEVMVDGNLDTMLPGPGHPKWLSAFLLWLIALMTV